MTLNRSTRNLTKKHDYFHIYREEWRISSLRNLLLQLLTSILILNWGSAFLQISIFFVSMLLRKLKHMKKCFFLIIIWQCVINMAPPPVFSPSLSTQTNQLILWNGPVFSPSLSKCVIYICMWLFPHLRLCRGPDDGTGGHTDSPASGIFPASGASLCVIQDIRLTVWLVETLSWPS